MKYIFFALLLLSMIAFLNSCAIYGAAVDERSIKTIASDHEIKAKILKKYADDEHVGVLDFSVSSYQGHVFLIGEYETLVQKNRAIQIAKGVTGVIGISTYLIADDPKSSCGPARNLELTTKIRAKLVGDKDIWSTNVDIRTIQCVAVLWGLVGSKKEIEKAAAHARAVEGIKGVKSFLRQKK